MNLRKLQPKDADGILGWMNDSSIRPFFRFEGDSTSRESVLAFIEQAQQTERNLHLAIVDDEDSYLGTVSLKSIDQQARNAEYAISTAVQVHGKGVAAFATREILRIAFRELGLHRVYLNVLEENARANRFYQKFGFAYEGQFREHILIRGVLRNLNWYSMLAAEFDRMA